MTDLERLYAEVKQSIVARLHAQGHDRVTLTENITQERIEASWFCSGCGKEVFITMRESEYEVTGSALMDYCDWVRI